MLKKLEIKTTIIKIKILIKTLIIKIIILILYCLEKICKILNKIKKKLYYLIRMVHNKDNKKFLKKINYLLKLKKTIIKKIKLEAV